MIFLTMQKTFNIESEWAFLQKETIKNAPQTILPETWVSTRELLLKAQVLLGKIGVENDEIVYINLVNYYLLTIDFYKRNLDGGLN